MHASAIAYNRVRFVCANPYGGGIDLGFNFYNGDYTKEARRAQDNESAERWRARSAKYSRASSCVDVPRPL